MSFSPCLLFVENPRRLVHRETSLLLPGFQLPLFMSSIATACFTNFFAFCNFGFVVFVIFNRTNWQQSQ